MRILVMSDSHSDEYSVRHAIEEQKNEASVLIHLGDGERDVDLSAPLLSGMKVVQVRGNCDFGSLLNVNEIIDVAGKRIFCTHGYVEHVKYGETVLEEKASQYNADIILYGHTHKAVTSFRNGVYYFNPGSIREGMYGFIDITPSGIMCVHRDMYERP